MPKSMYNSVKEILSELENQDTMNPETKEFPLQTLKGLIVRYGGANPQTIKYYIEFMEGSGFIKKKNPKVSIRTEIQPE